MRDYVIVCNEHKAMFPGCLLFWGCKTQDDEPRSFGGYTSDITECERYTMEELRNSGYNFPIYDGEDETEFRRIKDIAIKVDDLLSFNWLKTMTVVYRP